MACRCKNGRNEEQIRAVAFGGDSFLHVVDRHCPESPSTTPSMRAVCTPSLCQMGGSCEDQNQPSFAGNLAHHLKQRASILGSQTIVTEDDARAFGKRRDAGQQSIAHFFIRHQPQPGQSARGGVAFEHRPFYSGAMSEDAKANLGAVHDAMARAAKLSGRKPDSIALIAISKTRCADDIRPLLEVGQREYGENRVQEAQAKWPTLKADYPDVTLHLVGQLQSNKAEEAVFLFDVIHSVDRPSLITALITAQEKLDKRPRCFLQVNIGDEPQKGGCAVADVPRLLAAAAALDIVGLMAVPPDGVEAAPYFALLAKLARDNGLSHLSMGMSGDFETAIMLGATAIRVGTALFGARG
jgi:PLP dependent protein